LQLKPFSSDLSTLMSRPDITPQNPFTATAAAEFHIDIAIYTHFFFSPGAMLPGTTEYPQDAAS
jgi:hypothetical protein